MTIHLMNLSVYPMDLERYGSSWDVVRNFVFSHDLDGIELLIGSDTPPVVPKGLVHAVHLPSWMGWFRVWHEGKPLPPGIEQDEITYFYGAASPDDLITAFCSVLMHASTFSPSYATFHLCDITIEEYFTRNHSCSSKTVLADAARFFNEAASRFPGSEPPVRIAFENLWWPGLNYYDNEEVLMFMDLLKFTNWCLLLDTGHVMNGLCVHTEEEGIQKTIDTITNLSDRVIRAIDAVHLHYSASAVFQKEHFFCQPPAACISGPYASRMAAVIDTVTRLDEHRPFTLPGCADILRRVSPSFVTHEFLSRDREELSLKIKTQKKALSASEERGKEKLPF
ncbi:MAG: TIM barrel protein [Methanospirillaceae archaeon]|nr:TIM barrel protein [Methanospirillaceae archaeon]